MSKWRMHRGQWISTTPVLPGVWRVRDGGFWVRGRATNPKTGKLRQVSGVVDAPSAAEALAWMEDRLDLVRAGGAQKTTSRPRFAAYAVSLLDRKVVTGEIRSAKTRITWDTALRLHLMPAFGAFYLDAITRQDVEDWKLRCAHQVRRKAYSPVSVNGWIAILRTVMGAAVTELGLERNPMDGLEMLDTSTHRTYTREKPNALAPDQVPVFLDTMLELWPQHYAMTVLGFCTGLRPSSLRPLRRAGATPDLLWDEAALLVRRSHTVKAEVMEGTKTKRDQTIALPAKVIEILRWHETQLAAGPMRQSELLFPSTTGGFRSPSVLDKPFRDVSEKLESLGIAAVSPRAMRRTFQDLSRAAAIGDLVTRAVSGHATASMQAHYSTVGQEEMRGALAKVIDLATARRIA